MNKAQRRRRCSVSLQGRLGHRQENTEPLKKDQRAGHPEQTQTQVQMLYMKRHIQMFIFYRL